MTSAVINRVGKLLVVNEIFKQYLNIYIIFKQF